MATINYPTIEHISLLSHRSDTQKVAIPMTNKRWIKVAHEMIEAGWLVLIDTDSRIAGTKELCNVYLLTPAAIALLPAAAGDGSYPMTDAHGKAVLQLPPGHRMTVWAIYHDTEDPQLLIHSKTWILRPSFTVEGGKVVEGWQMWGRATHAEVRALIPPGLAMLAPKEGDDPKLVETWL